MRGLAEDIRVLKLAAVATGATVVFTLSAYVLLHQLWQAIYGGLYSLGIFKSTVSYLTGEGIPDPYLVGATWIIWTIITLVALVALYQVLRAVGFSPKARQAVNEYVADSAAEATVAFLSKLSPEQRELFAQNPRIEALRNQIALESGNQESPLRMLKAGEDTPEDKAANGGE